MDTPLMNSDAFANFMAAGGEQQSAVTYEPTLEDRVMLANRRREERAIRAQIASGPTRKVGLADRVIVERITQPDGSVDEHLYDLEPPHRWVTSNHIPAST